MDTTIVLSILISSILIFLIQILWNCKIKDFTLSKKSYAFIAIFVIIFNIASSFLLKECSISHICLMIILMILINLSFIDFKYYEISGVSYYFLIPPVIVYLFTNNIFTWWTQIISGIVLLLLFMVIDKLVGIEKIGGADVKLMLITALMFSYYEILILVFFIFLIDFILWIVLAIINKIKGGEKGVKIPMIVAISIATMLLTVFCKFVLYA